MYKRSSALVVSVSSDLRWFQFLRHHRPTFTPQLGLLLTQHLLERAATAGRGVRQVIPLCASMATPSPLCREGGVLASRAHSSLRPTQAFTSHRAPQRLRTATRLRASDEEDPNANGGGGGGFGDDLLDFMYAGRKLRRWYGQEGQVLPRDGRPLEEGPGGEDGREDAQDTGPRDQVLVLEADSAPMAEQVLLQLILARAKIKAVAKDAAKAKLGFGPYVEVLGGGPGDAAVLTKALRGVQALVLCGRVEPSALAAAAAAGVPHIVLLSAVGAPARGGFALFKNEEMAVLEDAAREAAVLRSGIAHTIVRVGGLSDGDGGESRLELAAGQAVKEPVSREDAASVVAQAALRDAGKGALVFGVRPAGAGAPPQDWAAAFNSLLSTPAP